MEKEEEIYEHFEDEEEDFRDKEENGHIACAVRSTLVPCVTGSFERIRYTLKISEANEK